MDEKKGLYVLGPLVVIIWAVLIYKFMDAFADDPPMITEEIKEPDVIRKPKKERILKLNYPDPFLGRSVPRKTVADARPRPNKPAKKQSKERKKQPKELAPKLRYNGRVENHGSGSERHLVAVNGSTRIVAIGEDVDGVKLERVYQDSVMFSWNKQKIFVRR